ncbi:MCE family protein [Mycolicibacterium sp. CBM1]
MMRVLNARGGRLARLPRMAVLIGGVAVITAVTAIAGHRLYTKLTDTYVTAYFSQTLSLYPGDVVEVLGVPIGEVDRIEPAGDKMRVSFHYAKSHKVPVGASASIINPSLIASRRIQLSPAYTGGAALADGDVIPIERTQVPLEWDDVRNAVNRVLTGLGPTPDQPKGPFGELIESAADGLAGKGRQLNDTLASVSDAVVALNNGRGDYFSTTRSLALFVDALYRSDKQFAELNNQLSSFTAKFTGNDHEVADALRDFNSLLKASRKFVNDNGEVFAADIQSLADVSNALVQPDSREGLESILHASPNIAANASNSYAPAHGGITASLAMPNFANPLAFICSSIQASSRLGYQDSAELCAQYLTPVLDAVKANYPPIGLNQFTSAMTLPNQISYSEDRLHPPTGFKDTTVPGIWARDTPWSFGNHEPGWIVAPGMQGVDVQALTANMLTPDSLAELLGGPDTSTSDSRSSSPANADVPVAPLPGEAGEGR